MSKKLAIVTGGTGGIGTEICKKLYQEGNEVLAIHHPSDNVTEWIKKQTAEGMDIHAMGADVSQWESSEKLVSQIEEKYGSVDIIVNNAGIIRDSFLKSMKPEAWDAVIQVNLNSIFYVTRLLIQKMIDRKFGRIINISSVNGHKGQMGQTNYSAAKAGIYGFTKSLAYETARHGITVNSVSPGYTNTPLVKTIKEDIRQSIIDSVPVKRLAEPWEIARVVSFLAHKDSSYITGADISINGGLYMY